MKKTLIIIIALALHQNLFSQDYNTIYYNSNWEVTSMKFRKYYRISGFDFKRMTFDSIVTDHFKDGNTEMTGKYLKGLKEGEFVFYYPNNSIKLIASYKNNMRSGLWTEYLENGDVSKEILYDNDKEKLLTYTDDKGVSKLKNGNCKFSMIFYFSPYFESYALIDTSESSIKHIIKGTIENGVKNGLWTLYEYNKIGSTSGNGWITKLEPRKICSVKYKNGEFLSGTYFFQNGLKKDIVSDIFTYLILEPDKIQRTESFFLEPGQLIKQNYLIKALQKDQKLFESTTNLEDESEIIDFFKSNYSETVKNCVDTFRINISLKIDLLGKVMVNSINPKIPSAFEKEVKRVISKIEKVNHFNNSNVDFVYRVWCTDELDYKK
jgi:antitoxin component YwqK of YwqJK toxin-antitoxin module